MKTVQPTLTEAELTETLGGILQESGAGSLREVRRRPSEYRTSFPLEELDAVLADGTRLRIAFKQLDWDRLDEQARLAKPAFLHDPGREPAVYEAVLPRAAPGPPRHYGSVLDPAAGRHWLFVEWVEGRELYQVGELELWCAAARWLAETHTALADDLPRHTSLGRLVEYDAGYYRRWMDRALEFAGTSPGGPDAASVEWLAERYEPVVEAMLAMPRTVIHGEFYASNVLVAEGPDGTRVAPVDWELAGAAPGAVDLAALVSGSWPEADRERIVAAYRSALAPAGLSRRDLDLARLHLAVQWLGWAPPAWVPPEGQRHDWLAEALELAGKLGL
jgi:aminoglycoside phosphotransferase (APT) family kinase protein